MRPPRSPPPPPAEPSSPVAAISARAPTISGAGPFAAISAPCQAPLIQTSGGMPSAELRPEARGAVFHRTRLFQTGFQGQQIGTARRQILLCTAIGIHRDSALYGEKTLGRPGPRDLEAVGRDEHSIPGDMTLPKHLADQTQPPRLRPYLPT